MMSCRPNSLRKKCGLLFNFQRLLELEADSRLRWYGDIALTRESRASSPGASTRQSADSSALTSSSQRTNDSAYTSTTADHRRRAFTLAFLSADQG